MLLGDSQVMFYPYKVGSWPPTPLAHSHILMIMTADQIFSLPNIMYMFVVCVLHVNRCTWMCSVLFKSLIILIEQYYNPWVTYMYLF